MAANGHYTIRRFELTNAQGTSIFVNAEQNTSTPLGDFTRRVIKVKPGQELTWTLVSSAPAPRDFSIDRDGNGRFEEPERLLKTPPGQSSGMLTIPADLPAGAYLFRVRATGNWLESSCRADMWGGAQDYTLLVLGSDVALPNETLPAKPASAP